MGMFDTLRCDYPLPDGYTADDFQTKSLDKQLEWYAITREGHLLRFFGGFSNGVPVGGVWRGERFSGLLNFYTGTRGDDGLVDWHEYDAEFVDGKLVSIKQIEDDR